jgi:hypothetical protein
VIEYTVSVAGQDAPELFALITDLLDDDAYPAQVLAAAYHWRWIGSETGLKEAKSTISGAGPSTGPMLRSGSPSLVTQEHASWITAVELARAAARAAAATAVPAGKGKRAGQPVHPQGDIVRRCPPRGHHLYPVRRSHRQPARRADRGEPRCLPGLPDPTPRRHRPQPAPRPQNQGTAGLPNRRTAPGDHHRDRPDQRLQPHRGLRHHRLPITAPSGTAHPAGRGTGHLPERQPGSRHARPPRSLSPGHPAATASQRGQSSDRPITPNYMALGTSRASVPMPMASVRDDEVPLLLVTVSGIPSI